VGGEGKTTLACHLATSLARAGRRTLLIDCDLRHPSIHQLVDIPAAPGVCEALRGEIAPEAAAVATDNNLWIMPAGRCDNLALQALSRDVSRKFFERLKNQYDFILVDSSPILAVADSILISQYVDATLFSILHTVSQFPKVSAAYERLARLGTPILGAIVTGMHNPLLDNEYEYLNQ
jgi:capsular exopolysaccharide synthesis family protein